MDCGLWFVVCAMMDDGRCDGEDGGKSSDGSRFCNFVERRKDTSGRWRHVRKGKYST